MREVIGDLLRSWQGDETGALATVVDAVRSAPRPPGASMFVAADGTVSGSLSGGCVEGAVYELAREVVADGQPVLRRYGFSDDEAFAVGLACGGIIDVFVEPVSRAGFPALGELAADLADNRPVAVATIIEHPDADWVGRRLVVRADGVQGDLGLARVNAAVTDDALGLLEGGTTAVLTYGPEGERMHTGMRVFVASHQTKPRMIVFGAIDFAAALARQGAMLGYQVTVCDARPLFMTRARFPMADEIVVAWPHHYLKEQIGEGRIDGRTALCVLTHDPKFDVPVLDVALRLEGSQQPAYIGAMGSRLTHNSRLVRLQDVGLTQEQLGRLSSPIGLDLGARTPEETAISIVAEIIAQRWNGTGDRLTDLPGRVHHDFS
ncbi:MAG: XshC-Cox1 family protein [Aeromicrobium sp.]|nr:XshC-Cox1 family protein [Aeromicrobium sp.]